METDTNNAPLTTHCLNCGTEFQGKFCPECGQSADTGKYTPRFLIDNLMAALSGRDGSIWFSVKSLFTRPGTMMVDNLNGKRKRYLSPFPMLFMVLTLYVLISALMNASVVDLLIKDEVEPPTEATIDDYFSYEATRLVQNGLKFYYNHHTLCIILTLPLALIAARVCYGKKNRKRYNWAEYAIVIVYSTVILMAYRCLTKLLFPIDPKATTAYGIMLSPLVAIIANTVCFRKMLGFSLVKTVWRSLLTELLYYILIVVVMLVIAIISAVYMAEKYYG